MEDGNTMRTNYYQRKIVGLYLIQHRETLRSYCGQSRDVLSRWKSHCSGGKKAVGIGAAIRDEGVDSFTFRVLEECSVSELNEREVFWIEHYDCVEPHGYNRNSGGGAPTYVSAATRKKMSASKMGNTAFAGKIPWNKGGTHSPETCEKMSSAHLGRTRSPEVIAASVEGKRRAKAARAATAEAASYSEPLQEALQSLRTDKTWTPMAEDGTPTAGPPAPSLEELEELLQML